MNNRKYISTEPQNSRTDGKGVTFAHHIYGEDTTVHFIERFQGEAKRIGNKWEQLIFTITFEDIGFGMTCKSKSTSSEESVYVEYGLSLMEEESLEEYYKTALMITKIHLKNSVKSMQSLFDDYEKGKHCWPLYKGNIKMYKSSHEINKKALESIDIEQSDFKYIKSFKEE